MPEPCEGDVTMRVRIGDSEIEVSGPREFVEAKVKEFLKSPPKVVAEFPPRIPVT